MNRDFVEMLAALSGAGAEYLVVGAHALAAHGLPRATGDLHIWVRATPDNAERVWAALEAFGAPLDNLKPQDLWTDDVVFQIGIIPNRIDLLTSISGVDFDDAWRNRLVISVSGRPAGPRPPARRPRPGEMARTPTIPKTAPFDALPNRASRSNHSLPTSPPVTRQPPLDALKHSAPLPWGAPLRDPCQRRGGRCRGVGWPRLYTGTPDDATPARGAVAGRERGGLSMAYARGQSATTPAAA